MPIEMVAAAVVPPGRPRIPMPGSILDVLQRDAGGEGLGHERVAQRVRGDALRCRDAGLALVHIVARPPLRVGVDRPFLFTVDDRSTGEPLFVGRVTNPSWS